MVWIARHADLDGLPAPSPEDLAEAASARRDGGGPRLLRRRRLRALVARTFDIHPDTVRFTRDASGRLRLEALAAQIATAGCHGWSAVALATRPIGVDIEADATDQTAELGRWTLVEAYLKALGLGLTLDPEMVRIEGRLDPLSLSVPDLTPVWDGDARRPRGSSPRWS